MSDHVDLVKQDALNRALRTLWTSIGVDAVFATGTGTLLLLNDYDPTSPLFWGAVGALAVRSLVTAAASYMVRLKVTPKAPES